MCVPRPCGGTISRDLHPVVRWDTTLCSRALVVAEPSPSAGADELWRVLAPVSGRRAVVHMGGIYGVVTMEISSANPSQVMRVILRPKPRCRIARFLDAVVDLMHPTMDAVALTHGVACTATDIRRFIVDLLVQLSGRVPPGLVRVEGISPADHRRVRRVARCLWSQRCSTCLLRYCRMVPCATCGSVWYCSVACYHADRAHHEQCGQQ